MRNSERKYDQPTDRTWREPRRMDKLVIKGYYRVPQHRYTLDLMCWRCHGRSIPTVHRSPPSGRENICTHFDSIGFSTCEQAFYSLFFIKSSPWPRGQSCFCFDLPSRIEYTASVSFFFFLFFLTRLRISCVRSLLSVILFNAHRTSSFTFFFLVSENVLRYRMLGVIVFLSLKLYFSVNN